MLFHFDKPLWVWSFSGLRVRLMLIVWFLTIIRIAQHTKQTLSLDLTLAGREIPQGRVVSSSPLLRRRTIDSGARKNAVYADDNPQINGIFPSLRLSGTSRSLRRRANHPPLRGPGAFAS